jgi:hypothetical protein
MDVDVVNAFYVVVDVDFVVFWLLLMWMLFFCCFDDVDVLILMLLLWMWM